MSEHALARAATAIVSERDRARRLVPPACVLLGTRERIEAIRAGVEGRGDTPGIVAG